MLCAADVTVLTEAVNCDSGLYVLIGLAETSVIQMIRSRVANHVCQSPEK